ncbi:hypothetical protein GCM10020001_050100 [Nonomuraea salmonea]
MVKVCIAAPAIGESKRYAKSLGSGRQSGWPKLLGTSSWGLPLDGDLEQVIAIWNPNGHLGGPGEGFIDFCGGRERGLFREQLPLSSVRGEQTFRQGGRNGHQGCAA